MHCLNCVAREFKRWGECRRLMDCMFGQTFCYPVSDFYSLLKIYNQKFSKRDFAFIMLPHAGLRREVFPWPNKYCTAVLYMAPILVMLFIHHQLYHFSVPAWCHNSFLLTDSNVPSRPQKAQSWPRTSRTGLTNLSEMQSENKTVKTGWLFLSVGSEPVNLIHCRFWTHGGGPHLTFQMQQEAPSCHIQEALGATERLHTASLGLRTPDMSSHCECQGQTVRAAANSLAGFSRVEEVGSCILYPLLTSMHSSDCLHRTYVHSTSICLGSVCMILNPAKFKVVLKSGKKKH